MRAIHRTLCFFVVIFTLYLSVTGTWIQLIDFKTLFTHAKPSDPEMIALREGKDGPDDYVVLTPTEYGLEPLPSRLDVEAAFDQLLSKSETFFAGHPVDYVELRMAPAGVEGLAHSGKTTMRYDLATQGIESIPDVKASRPAQALRSLVKRYHRMNAYGDWALWINPLVGISLGVFVVTGLVIYWQLYAARRRLKKRQVFWSAGGQWRSLHRWIALTASVFVLSIALSGEWLAVEALLHARYVAAHRPSPGQPFVSESGVGPLDFREAPATLTQALATYQGSLKPAALKVVRLRVYGGMPQGILITGLGADTQQTVVNGRTGRPASMTEPGYPPTGFPFGWQAHQTAKQIHRGSYIGLSGRWMDLYGGLAIAYLSLSGIVMYVDQVKRRRKAGRNALIWSR